MAIKAAYEELNQRFKEIEDEAVKLRKVEKAPLASEEFFSQFMNYLPCLVWIKNRDGQVIYLNMQNEEFFGIKTTDWLGKTSEEIWPPKIAAKIRKEDELILKGRKIECISKRFINGEFRSLFRRKFLIQTNNTPLICGVCIDVTKRIRAEEDLRESEKRYRGIVRDQTELICRFKPDGTLLFVNESFFNFFNKNREELIGSNLFSLITENNRARAKKFFKNFSRDNPVNTIELQIIKPCGKICWQQWTARALFSPGSEIYKFQGVGRDITELKKSEIALKERTKRLEITSQNLEEANTALKVLLRKRDEDSAELEERVLTNMKQLIEPVLNDLKKTRLDNTQKASLDTLKKNLNDILSPFSRSLTGKYLNFTPSEIRVANLIKQGMATKEISELSNLSTKTVETHRKNIRKKLGLTGKKTNLRTTLLTL